MSKPKKIPKFKTIQEEAEFWDTHSPLDYPDEFEDIENVRFVRPPKEVMTIRMDKAVVDLIRRVARKRGLQHTTLVREWIVERATEEARSADPSSRKKKGRKPAAKPAA